MLFAVIDKLPEDGMKERQGDVMSGREGWSLEVKESRFVLVVAECAWLPESGWSFLWNLRAVLDAKRLYGIDNWFFDPGSTLQFHGWNFRGVQSTWIISKRKWSIKADITRQQIPA
jgi:hypothetical protein